MNEQEKYIAVFDSGVGGISVLRHLCRLMPQEKFLYFGDSGNAPYGSRPTAEVRRLSLSVAKKLVEQGIKALVVACNTATAAAIDTLRAAYPELIVVGIEPALKLASDRFPGGTVGVLATEVTLREEKFQELLSHYGKACTVISLPAPGLVELVEQGKGNSHEAQALLRPILAPWAGKLDALVLGCTHYPFAKQAISACIGPETALLDGGEGTARETLRRLEKAKLLRAGQGSILWQTSGDPAKFTALCETLMEK